MSVGVPGCEHFENPCGLLSSSGLRERHGVTAVAIVFGVTRAPRVTPSSRPCGAVGRRSGLSDSRAGRGVEGPLPREVSR